MPVSVRLSLAILMLIAAGLFTRLHLEWRLLSQPFHRSRTTTMGAINPSFSAERCADLHNRLLQQAIANGPSAVVERSLITGLLDVSTDVAGFSIPESSPLHHFLSLLDTVALPHSRFIPLTPEICQPFSGSVLE